MKAIDKQINRYTCEGWTVKLYLYYLDIQEFLQFCMHRNIMHNSNLIQNSWDSWLFDVIIVF